MAIRRVLMLPGQGIQYVGMTERFEQFSGNRHILERIDSALGYNVKAS